ncbi:hypothetical protein BGX20_004535, partial [Mortierella sp. AD010]
MTDKTTLITLTCILDGEDTAFPIDISLNKTIGHLKDDIYGKISTGPEVKAKDLTLWHVSILIDVDEEEDDKPILLKDYLVGAKKIRAKQAATEICEIFGPALPKNTIHVIVQLPAAAS